MVLPALSTSVTVHDTIATALAMDFTLCWEYEKQKSTATYYAPPTDKGASISGEEELPEVASVSPSEAAESAEEHGSRPACFVSMCLRSDGIGN